MKKLALLSFLFCDLCLAEGTFGISKHPKQSFAAQVDGELIYKGRTSNLVADSLSKIDGKKLFVVRLPLFIDIKPDLEKFAKILLVEESDYALVELTGKEQDLAELAHNKNGACGPIVKLGNWSPLVKDDSGLSKVSKPMNSPDKKLKDVVSLISKVESTKIYNSILFMENMGSRYHKSEQGKLVPKSIGEKYRALIPSGRKDVEIKFVDVKRSPQDNLVVRIVGSETPDEIVVLGSHIDSIVQWGRGQQAPGADDDASGTATNLEIFRILMENGITPKKTIEFHGYAAEEAGLVGSADLANQYLKLGVDVVSMVQMDMNLYSGRQNSLDTMWFVSNGTNDSLTENLKEFARSYLGVKTVSARLTAGTSDHQSWAQRGFVAAFPFENPNEYNRKIHTKNDRAAVVGNADFSALYAKLGLAYLGHYAGFVN